MDRIMPSENGFYIAPYSPNGERVGLAFWKEHSLAQQWLETCKKLLTSLGPTFRSSWGQQLDHIELKLTSDSGAGIGTFFVHGQIAASAAYFSGLNSDVDHEVAEMFVESLKRTGAQFGSPNGDFSDLLSVESRPLAVVVPWGNPEVDEQDADLVRDLGLHFASAFFTASGSAAALKTSRTSQ